MKVRPDITTIVVGGGSGTGITALLDGTTDICMSSRPLKMEERERFEEKGANIQQIVIGHDALSVVVHPDNPVTQLTREQLEQIYSGETTNWKMVGGRDMPIVVYSRESSSGSYEYFREQVLGHKNFTSRVLNLPATGAIVQSVRQTPGAIGYIGMAYVSPALKTLKISFDGGKTYVAPTAAEVKAQAYPLSRPLLYLYDAKNEAKVTAFLEYILSDAGQKNVTEIGYIPVK